MEIATIYYRAKDGRLFTDPLKCEEYEKGLGIIPGSIADMVQHVRKNAGGMKYMSGAVFFRRPDGKSTFHEISTACIDDRLESFVNVKDLQKEQRYVEFTVEEFFAYYDTEEKRDFPCQYLLSLSKEIEMNSIRIMSNGNNPDLWEKKEE